MCYTIYCDGAFSPSRNTGGIAFIILNSKKSSEDVFRGVRVC